MDDEFFMKKALQEAQKAYDIGEVPVGAVVVQNDRIIGRGYNQVELLKDATAHAEMLALTAAFGDTGAKYLPNATIYITVEPCVMCCGAIYWSKLSRIVYGAEDIKHGFRHPFEENYGMALNMIHPKTTLTAGVLKEDCAQLMKAFFRERR